MNFRSYLLSFFLLITCLLHAQIQVSDASIPPFTPENLITNYFLGEGVTVLSVTYEGSNKAVGYFDKAKNNVGIQRGICMSTGRVDNDPTNLGVKGIANPGSTGASSDNGIKLSDPDIAKIVKSGQSINDMSKYTITFIPTSDTLRFKYVFASEEYPEYACSPFNDVFGFFISGPGINGTFQNNGINIALVPGTNLPVSIDNIHPQNGANCPPKNAQFYIANGGSKQPVYDGLTKVFTAEAIVIPCQTYTIKLIIADASDGILDSGVFLEAKSFGTGALKVSPTSVSLDGTVVEGCTDGKVSFSLPKKLDADYPIDVNIIGTATNGVDYQTIPTNLTISAGDSLLEIPIVAFDDNSLETIESIGFDVKIDICHRDTFWIYIKDNKIVKPNLGADKTICKGESTNLDATLAIALPPPSVFTNKDSVDINTVTPFNPNIPATISSIDVYGVQPITLQDGMIESVCINMRHQWIDDIDCYLVAPNGQFINLSTDNGGSGGNGAGIDYYKNTCFSPDATLPITSGTVPFTGSFQPEGIWSDLWGSPINPVNGKWKLQILDDQTGAQGKLLDWSITFKPYYRLNYKWTPTKGLSCSDCPNPIAKPDSTTTYVVVVSDNYGCPVTDSITINVVDSLDAPKVICNIVTHNSIQFAWQQVPFATVYEVSIDGGPWISPSNTLTHKITGLSLLETKNIRVRAIGGNCGGKIGYGSCTTLNCISATPKVEKIVDISCFGKKDGAIEINATDGIAPYTFAMGSQTNSTGVFSNLSPGKYTISVTEKAGCVSTVNVEIYEPKALKFQYSIDSVSCFGGQDGAAILSISGGTLPYQYQWFNGVTDSFALGLKKYNYAVTVTDINKCSIVDTVKVFEPKEMQLTFETVNNKCFGDAEGTAKVLVKNGYSPFQFAWNTNKGLQIGVKAIDLVAGKHYITVTDDKGCEIKGDVDILEPNELISFAKVTNALCFASKEGSIEMTTNGGTLPYSYIWDDANKSKTDKISNLTQGIYSVTISDKNACSFKSTSIITAPDSLEYKIKVTNPKCFGDFGSIETTVTGGILPYSYIWDNGELTNVATQLDANTIHTVTIYDLNQCEKRIVCPGFTIPAKLEVDFAIQASSCNGAATGEIITTPKGGTSPYQYNWKSNNFSANTKDIKSLISGTYDLTITDANDCTLTKSVLVEEPNAVKILGTVHDVKCFGANTGDIQLDIQGGTAPYLFDWNNGSNSEDLTSLTAGTYIITVTDANKCIKTANYTVSEPVNALSATINVSDTLCFGKTGNAKIVVLGGTTPYKVEWQNGTIGVDLTNEKAGVYPVKVTDANSCILNDSAKLTELQEVKVDLSQTSASCFASADGAAKIDAIYYGNQIAPNSKFSINWSNFSTSIINNNLTGGKNYSVTVSDSRGCSAKSNITIGNPNAIETTFSNLQSPKCHGENNGSITVSGKGGTLPYTFLWDNNAQNQQTDIANNLSAGKYQVTVTDSKGCSISNSTFLSEPTKITLTTAIKKLDCPETQTGAIEITSQGGTSPYQYLWNTSETTNKISKLLAGNYFVTISDANGCKKDTNIYVGQPKPLDVQLISKDATCAGKKNGQLTVNVSGGTAPFSFSLDNNPFSSQNVYANLSSNTYSLIIKDKNGCLLEQTATISEPDAVEVDLGKDTTILYGESVKLTPIILNNIGKITYSWNPNISDIISCADCKNPIVKPIVSTYFTLKVVDSLGCTQSDNINITIKLSEKILVPTAFTPNNDDKNELLLIHGEKNAKIVHFAIYDRWGELVYQHENSNTNDINVGWDGSFKGKEAPIGVYTWVANVVFENGDKKIFRGNTTLLRN